MGRLALWLSLGLLPGLGGVAHAGDADRGARLAGLAGCAACHTPEGDDAVAAGGFALETPFGTFYGSNLTPDPETGLGDWTFEDFERAMRRGKSPEGRPYYPAFPYPSFTLVDDRDLEDLWAWLRTLEPVRREVPDHEVRPAYRGAFRVGLWRWFGFRRGPWEDDPDHDAAWNRGAYLVEGLGHCGECHTPRTGIGVPRRRWHLAGTDLPPEPGPNLTPHEDALADWSVGDWTDFLDLGMLPDGDFVGGEMARVVDEGTAVLSDEDRAAIATYLRSLTPRPDR